MIGSKVVLGFDGRAVQRGLAGLSRSFSGMAMGGIGGIVKPFAQLGALLAPTALVGGMVAFGKASSEAAANLENIKANFDIFTGSSAGTDKLIKQLRKIAVESPLELTDIAEGARQLLLFNVSAEDTAKHIERLSEISGGSAERFGRLAYAFGQVKNLGYILGTEVRQLNEAGFNPLTEIMKKTGESAEQIQERMADHKVLFEEVAGAMETATSAGGRFFGLNAKMAQTFTGRVSMMKDAWSQLTQSFGTGMNEGLKVAANAITTNIPNFIEGFKSMGEYFGQAIADSVAGNYDKFVAIGTLIGSAIQAGVSATYRTMGESAIKGTLDFLSKDRLSGLGDAAKWASNQIGDPLTMQDAVRRSLESNGVGQKIASIQQGNQGIAPGSGGRFRYAKEGETSVFSDAAGNKVIEVLQRIENNTKTGSKM